MYRSGHNGPDSKSGSPQGLVGSNPTASAKALKAKGYPAQGQQQNYRSEQDKRATIMMIAARLL